MIMQIISAFLRLVGRIHSDAVARPSATATPTRAYLYMDGFKYDPLALPKDDSMTTYQTAKPAHLPYAMWCASEMWPRATIRVTAQDLTTNQWVRVFRRNQNIPIRRWSPMTVRVKGQAVPTLAYEIDLRRMLPDEKFRLLKIIAHTMALAEDVVAENINRFGVVILAEAVIVTPPVRLLN